MSDEFRFNELGGEKLSSIISVLIVMASLLYSVTWLNEVKVKC